MKYLDTHRSRPNDNQLTRRAPDISSSHRRHPGCNWPAVCRKVFSPRLHTGLTYWRAVGFSTSIDDMYSLHLSWRASSSEDRIYFAAFYDSNPPCCDVGGQGKRRSSALWTRKNTVSGRKDRPGRVRCWARFETRSCCNVGGDSSPLTSPLTSPRYTVVAHDLNPDGDSSTCACMSGAQQVWKELPSSLNYEGSHR